MNGRSDPPAATGALAPVMVWFRRDLRLADHPAFAAAARSGHPLLPVFIFCAASTRDQGAGRWWLHGSLSALDAALRNCGSRLVLRSGDPAATLAGLARETGARALFFNRSWQPDERHCEKEVRTILQNILEINDFTADCLHEPGSLLSAAGEPLRVFTPFWRACRQRGEPAAPLPLPHRWTPWTGAVRSEALNEWRLLPTTPDWAGGLRERWQPGEPSATRALQRFTGSGLQDYAGQRDRLDCGSTSRLSPHLHFGEISPRQLWQAVRLSLAHTPALERDGEAFLRQLAWREFSLHLLHFWPGLSEREFQPRLAGFPWRRPGSALRHWQRGETGYPLVDAAMRELLASGWLHNRARMTVASFLVKHLLIDWREGLHWFTDTLVDADQAVNTVNWQWVAGCGADAAPWFRIFNPVLQGQKFDPQGEYVKQWLPELAQLPARHVHAPWRAPASVLRAAGIRLGSTYPRPMVDHDLARDRALTAWRTLQQRSRAPAMATRGR